MTLNPQPYSTYKPSDVLWLDELPAHWEVRPLKRLLVEPLKYGANEPGQYSDHTDPRYIRITDISEDGRLRDDSFRSLPKEIAEPYLLTGGDILFARSGATVGKTFQYRPNWGKAAHAGYLIRARFNKTAIEPDFIEYYTQSQIYRDWILGISIQATIQNVSAERYGGLRIPLPPLSEQRAIVRYLDHVDRRIHRYIDAKRKLIDLLEEEKQAIINQAVTRGLDPNVRLKSSAVGWLGDVPEHWEVAPLNRVSAILRGKFTHRPRNDPSLYDGAYPFIQNGDVASASKMIMSYKQTLNEKGLAVSTMFPSGTLVMTIAANIGDVAILDFNSCFPDSIVGVIPSKNIYRDHLYYLFRAMKREFIREAPVNTQGNLNVDRIGSRKVVLPPFPEQIAIVDYLDKATSEIDSAISRARRQMELLQEYRTRLISDVVTGKLDVRDVAAQLHEEGDDGRDPVVETGPMLDNMDEDSYNASQPTEEELAIESEVTA